MHHFAYRDGVLHAEAVNLDTLAAAVGTPFYCYSTATLTRHYEVFAGAFADVRALVCYAMKANSNQAVIATLAKLAPAPTWCPAANSSARGWPAFPRTRSCSRESARPRPNSRWRSTKAFSASTSSPKPELELLSSIAAAKGRTAHVSVRVNPDIDAKTHSQDRHRQGREQVRHSDQPRARGLCPRRQARASRSPASTCISAARSPSSIRSAMLSRCLPSSSVCACRWPHHLACRSRRRLGIPYRDDNEPPPHPDAYAEVVKRATRDLDCRLIFEPGRLIVGNAGILVTRVLFVKHGEAKNFVVVDAAMNDLIRPTLYDAHHEIWPVTQPSPRRVVSAPMWSGRCVKAAISSPSTAIWWNRQAVHCLP